MSEVQKRVEALRQAKKAEEDTAENKRKDELIQWEAELILALEEYTDERIMKEFTDDIDKFNYLYKLLPKLGYNLVITSEISQPSKAQDVFGINRNIIQNPPSRRIMLTDIQKYLITDDHNERAFKARYVYRYLMRIIETSEYIEKERVRKEKIAYEKRIAKEKIDEEERIVKAKADAEENIRRQQIIDETNININTSLKNTQHTFSNLTLSDWNKLHEKEFITYNKDWGWSHFTIDIGYKRHVPWYNGMPSSFVNYYEEGKVPFFTKCPTCNSPTKFNYLNMIHHNGWGGHESQKSCSFKEVYCDNHYVYDSSTNKHYRANPSGTPLHFNHPMQGSWSIDCWTPKGNWSIWDPSDPDGSKALAEKKKKEADEIRQKIAELQAKLIQLT